MSKKYVLTWIAIAFSVVLFTIIQTSWASSQATALQNESCGGLAQEAEQGQLFGDMKIGNSGDASGGKYVFVPESSGQTLTFENNPHKAEYCVEIQQGGDYQIQTWVYARNTAHDSMFVAIDGEPSAGYLWDATVGKSFIKDAVRNRGEDGPKTITLAPGSHTLTFSNREPDTKLDRFELVRVGGSEPEPTGAPTEAPTEVSPTQAPPTQEPTAETPENSCGGLEQEAEAATLFGAMTIGTDQKASGDQFIYIPSEQGKSTDEIDHDHRAEFCVDISEAGDYQIIGWAQAGDKESDSFYVTVDNAPAKGYLWDIKRSDDFVEDYINDRRKSDPQIITLSKGEHLLTIYHREPNARLDKIKFEKISDGSPEPTVAPTEENPTATPIEPTATTVPPTIVPTAPPSSCGGMVQEAETATLHGGMTIGSDQSASGGQFIYVPGSFGKSTSGISREHRAEFCVTLPEDGDYKIIGRASAANNESDSFYITVDNSPAQGYLWDVPEKDAFVNDDVNDRRKSDPQIIRLAAGEHILSVYHREPNTKLDRIEFVLLAGGVPVEPTATAGVPTVEPTEEPPTQEPTAVPPTAVPTTEVDSCGGLVQEAEDAELFGLMAIGNSGNASGGKYISAPASVGESLSAVDATHRADFCINVESGGEYRIIGRVQASSGTSDSFFVALDGDFARGYLWDVKRSSSFVNDEVNNRKKADPQILVLTAGEHTLSMINREPGVKLDRIELVQVSEGAPVEPTPTKPPVTPEPTEVPPTVVPTIEPTSVPPTAVPPTPTKVVTPEPDPVACGGLEQEAEDAQLFGGMTIGYDGSASGGRFIFVSKSRGNSSSPDGANRADFCVTIPETGEYKIEAQVKAADTGSNSFFVTVDDAPAAGYLWEVRMNSKFVDDVVNDRGKSDPQIIFLTAGEHMITMHHREPGTQLDKISVVSTSGSGGVIPQPTSTPVTPEATTPPPTATPISGNGNVYYVSRNGNNANGRSWETAWNELNRINWGVLKAGDTVYIDGGNNSMTYRTTLEPKKNGSSGNPILIQLSGESGRNGQAIFFGGNSVPLPECGVKSWNDSQHRNAGDHGIAFMNSISNITVDGTKRHGIVIHGWKSNGIQFDRHSTTRNITLRYIEIYNNGGTKTVNDGGVRLINPSHSDSGIELGGIGHKFQFMEIHDNSGDAIQSGAAPNQMEDFTLTDSWLYNQRPHSGKDNSPSSDVCTKSNQSGCDEYGAPDMGPDYWNYPNPPRTESFNWCTHSDGIQIFTGNAFENMTVERSIIGPNFMTAMLLGDRNSSSTTAWVNNLRMRDVVLTRFMHNGVGMKNPSNNAGRNWDLENVTIYGHQNNRNKVSLHADWTGGPNHRVADTIVVNGHVKFPHAHVSFSNNCQWQLYSGSVNGDNVDPRFRNIVSGDVFEPNLNVDFATVFKDDYRSSENRCGGAGSGTYSVSSLLSRFNR